ncbi:hypothetical protein Bca52824_031828 [Brassica carinata]|uniref:Zinc finger GRF-type domain-containing protein n=1 Tax=Brassica carinata TaxID=52824 RepID=A0A8X7SBX0_BRACI|nr:hypothetical protein Bca52824_031828 [Brassica carinata]
MDPAEEIRDSKRHKEYANMLRYTCDSEYGIPRRCSCGGRIIDEVKVKEEHDTLPGKRFFTCANYEANGLHIRQPWVIGVQEQLEWLTKRVEAAEEEIKFITSLKHQIQTLEGKAKELNLQVDRLTGEVYNLTVHVEVLEKLCFEARVEGGSVLQVTGWNGSECSILFLSTPH